MCLGNFSRPVIVQTAGIGPEIVGVGQVAVDTRHRFPFDLRLLGLLIQVQALQQIIPGIDHVFLLLVHLGQETQGLPGAVIVVLPLGVDQHLVQQRERRRDLSRIEIVVLRQFVRIVVVLGETRLPGHFLQTVEGLVHGIVHLPPLLGRDVHPLRAQSAQGEDIVKGTGFLVVPLDSQIHKPLISSFEFVCIQDFHGPLHFLQAVIAPVIDAVRIVLRRQRPEGRQQQEKGCG